MKEEWFSDPSTTIRSEKEGTKDEGRTIVGKGVEVVVLFDIFGLAYQFVSYLIRGLL